MLTNRERYFVETIEHILFENYKFRTKIQRCIFCKLAVFPVQREHITQNLILLLITLNWQVTSSLRNRIFHCHNQELMGLGPFEHQVRKRYQLRVEIRVVFGLCEKALTLVNGVNLKKVSERIMWRAFLHSGYHVNIHKRISRGKNRRKSLVWSESEVTFVRAHVCDGRVHLQTASIWI